ASLSPGHARFEGPGLSLDTDFLVFAVGNARATGGGTVITPEASVQDGLLDLCVVEGMTRVDFAKLLPRVRRGEHLYEDGVNYLQLPHVRIDSTTPITVNVDGESRQLSELDYVARRGDLLIHLPRLPGEGEAESG